MDRAGSRACRGHPTREVLVRAGLPGVVRPDRGPEFFRFALRYTPGTNLARRFPGVARGRFRTRAEAERVRAACVNAAHIEVVDLLPPGARKDAS